MTFSRLFRKTLLYHVYVFIALRVRRWSRKQRVNSSIYTTYEGIRLRIDQCSPFMRNVILDQWYEKPERLLCARHLVKTDRILELGSAIGFLSLYCTLRLQIAQIALVEANPRTIEILRTNYALNGLTPFIISCAVSDRSGTAELDVGGEFWGNSLLSPKAGSSTRSITVPTRTFQDLLAGIGFQPTALIIDIEGGETAIDPVQIPGCVEVVLIEIHPLVIGVEAQHRLLARFDERGFRVVDYREGTYCMKRGSRLSTGPDTIDAA